MQTEPNDEEPQVDPELIERSREAMAELDSAAQKLGLYQQGAQLAVDNEGRVVVVSQFLIGDVAYSDRVQNPEADQTEDKFRAIASDMKKQEFDELQERLRQQHGGSDGS